ncbi:hypothetical protein ACLB1Q_33465 [Escherichia coli]
MLAINDTHLLEQLTPQLLNGSRDLLRHAGVVLADCNLTAEALEWVFTLADQIPVFVDTVSEFKAAIKPWLAHIHTQTHFTGAGNFMGTGDHQRC